MSALGHKRTFRSAITMSALPPKADIRRMDFDVRFSLNDVRFTPKSGHSMVAIPL
jgi:hypothetical protein